MSALLFITIIIAILVIVLVTDLYFSNRYYKIKQKGVIMFGEKFRVIRGELGLTQEEFGKFFGVSRQCIWYWENDKRDIPNDALIKLQKLCRSITFNPILFIFDKASKPFNTIEHRDTIKSIILRTIEERK